MNTELEEYDIDKPKVTKQPKKIKHHIILNQETQTITFDNIDIYLPSVPIGNSKMQELIKMLDKYSFYQTGRKFRLNTRYTEKHPATLTHDKKQTMALINVYRIFKEEVGTDISTDHQTAVIKFIPEDLSKEEQLIFRYHEIMEIKRTDPKRFVNEQHTDAFISYLLDLFTGNNPFENVYGLDLLDCIYEKYGREPTFTEPYRTVEEIYDTIRESDINPDIRNVLHEININNVKWVDTKIEEATAKLKLLESRQQDGTDQATQTTSNQDTTSSEISEEERAAIEKIKNPYKHDKPKKKIKYNSKLNDGYRFEIPVSKMFLNELLESLIINDKEDYPSFHEGKGRPELPLRDKIFCNIDRIMFNMTTRSYPESDNVRCAIMDKYIIKCPSPNSLSNFLLNPKSTPILQALLQLSASPMAMYETQLAVDSSGFRTSSYNEWLHTKYNIEVKKALSVIKSKAAKNEIEKEIKKMKSKRMKIWKKAHIIIGTKTGVIISMRVTNNEGEGTADINSFEPLLVDATKYFDVREVVADKGYSARSAYAAGEKLGIKIYIPFKITSKPRAKGVPTWTDTFYLAKENPEEFYEHYKVRNNVESTFGAVKKSLGETIKSKDEISQINELYCKMIAYNLKRTAILTSLLDVNFKRYISETESETSPPVNQHTLFDY